MKHIYNIGYILLFIMSILNYKLYESILIFNIFLWINRYYSKVND